MGGKFVDYSIPRGDREDDEEIEVKYNKYKVEQIKEVEKLEPEVKEQKPKLKVPRAFDEKYYSDHVSTAHEKHSFDKKYILYWEQLERYAKSAYNFYTHVMCEFYKIVKMPERMPDFVKPCLDEEYDIFDIVKSFKKCEEETISLLYRQGKDIPQLLERHKRIAELREYTSTAWLVFEDLSNKRFLPRLTKMQNKFNQIENQTEEDVVAFYAGHTRANYYVPKHFLNFFNNNGDFAKNHMSLMSMYKDVNSNAIFKNLIMDINAYDTKKEHNQIYEMANGVTTPTNIEIVELYNNYNDIKYIIKKLNNLDVSYDLLPFEETVENSKTSRDIYQTAKQYLNQTLKVKHNIPNVAIYKKIQEDLEYIINSLNYVIDKNKENYLNYCEEIKDINKRLNEMSITNLNNEI